jgi:hypothetical protein
MGEIIRHLKRVDGTTSSYEALKICKSNIFNEVSLQNPDISDEPNKDGVVDVFFDDDDFKNAYIITKNKYWRLVYIGTTLNEKPEMWEGTYHTVVEGLMITSVYHAKEHDGKQVYDITVLGTPEKILEIIKKLGIDAKIKWIKKEVEFRIPATDTILLPKITEIHKQKNPKLAEILKGLDYVLHDSNLWIKGYKFILNRNGKTAKIWGGTKYKSVRLENIPKFISRLTKEEK